MYYAKLSIPGKLNTELSYVFIDSITEQQNSSVVLFGMFDILSTSEVYHTIIKQAVKHYLDFYHSASPIDTLSSDDLPDSKEFVFENSIQYTYEKVSDELRDLQEKSSQRQAVDLKKINCILGAVIDDMLYLSITGTTIKPLLVYPVSHRNGPVQYMLVNIAEADHGGDGHARLFSQLISGPVSIPSSSIIVCNQTFLDYISAQQIKQAISNSKVQAVIPSFEHLLSRVHARHDFSALLIARDAHAEGQRGQRGITAASSLSMADLNGTASSTQSIMKPTIRPYLGQVFRACYSIGKKSILRIIQAFRSAVAAATTPEQIRRYRSILTSCTARCREVSTRVPYFFRQIRGFLISSWTSLRSGNARRHCIAYYHARALQGINATHRMRTWFLSLNKLSRALFILSALFVVLFLVSLVTIQLHNTRSGKESRLREIVTAVEQKQLAADASLIYDDKARARELIRESEQLLALVDERFADREELKAARRTVDNLRQRIDNIIRIEEPAQLAVLPDGAAAARSLHLFAVNTTIIISDGGDLFSYDRTAQTLAPLPLKEKIPSISCGAAQSDTIIVLCSGSGDRLYTLNLPSMTVQSSALKRSGTARPSHIVFYGDRLYALSADGGSIDRHNGTGDAYAAGVSWIRESADAIVGARDIAIDGLAYILTKDGQLAIYRSGRKSRVSIPQETTDLLRDTQRIITSADLEYLYALNPIEKRIIVIHKSSFAPVAQITSPLFDHMQDFSISKTRKTILVLDKGRLLSLPYDVK